jgi:heme-degrading monooxygenase HmoA
MFARVHWGKIKAGMWDDYEKFYDQRVVKSTEDMNGFRGRRLLRSVDDPEEGMSISLSETKGDLESYINSSQRKDLGRDAERLYTGEYWVKIFEIRSSTI